MRVPPLENSTAKTLLSLSVVSAARMMLARAA